MHSLSKFFVAAPPDGRALWLRHDGISMHLMASTCLVPAGLVLPVDDCFEVRILRVDQSNKCLYLRPVTIEKQSDQLDIHLSKAGNDDSEHSCHSASQPLNMSTVYMAQTENGYLRAVLLKKEQASSVVMYAIDLGKVLNVNASDVRELMPSLRSVPPLCFCVTLDSCNSTCTSEEYGFFVEGTIGICKISTEFPSNYPQRAKEMYPPAILSKMYEEKECRKFVEIKCTAKVDVSTPTSPASEDQVSRTADPNVTYASVVAESSSSKKNNNSGGGSGGSMSRRRSRALVVKSASAPTISRDPGLPFMFQKFNVSLPAQLTARVTERIDYDTYLMRNQEVLDNLEKLMVAATTPLVPRSFFDRGVCCIARMIRPAKLNCSSFQPQMYRAIASHYRPGDNTCEALLVDFGQTVICNVSDLFELKDQPPEVLETATTSFRCRVKRFSPSKKNGSRAIKLRDEMDYSVCLTLKCARDLYWAKVTLTDADFVVSHKKPRIRPELDEKMSEDMRNNNASLQTADIGRELNRRREELLEEEERLHKEEELLRKEQEKFANESKKRDEDLQLLALQMQLWDISTKLDFVAATSHPNYLRANQLYPHLQHSSHYGAIPMNVTNGYGHPGICYSTANNGFVAQQQQNVMMNQSAGQQWLPYNFPAPPCHVDHGNQQYPHMAMSNELRAPISCGPDAPTARFAMPFTNVQGDFQCGTGKYCRNMNENAAQPNWHTSSQRGHSPQKWHGVPVEVWSGTVLPSDTSSESTAGQPVKLATTEIKARPPLAKTSPAKKVATPPKTTSSAPKIAVAMASNPNTGRNASLLGDSSWDNCHRKLEYGEPPHRTISDYCNIANSKSKQTSPLKRSFSVVSHYGRNVTKLPSRPVPQLKFKGAADAEDVCPPFRKCSRSGVENQGIPELRILSDKKAADGDALQMIHIADGAAHEEEVVVKPIYTSDESSDSETEHVCADSNSYEQQETLAPTESHLSLHFDSDPLPLPAYQMHHECNNIAEGSEMLVRRVGSDSDWPIFFVTPATVLKDLSADYFDSLCPTQKLSDSEISPSVRTHPALAVPCILASVCKLAQLDGAARLGMNEVPNVGQLLHVLFKTKRDSDGVWIVELIKKNNSGFSDD